MIIQNTITIDLSAPGAPRRMIAVEGDSGTRSVEIRLTDSSVAWQVPAGVSASLRYAKPDGTSGWYDTLPDGSSACAISGNTVTVALAPQVLTVPGIVTAAVTLQKGEERLTTISFFVDVRSCPGDAESKDYYAIAGLDRPTQWHCGTAITGTGTVPTAFAGSGIDVALVGDLYLNTQTGDTYRCTTAGSPSTALWAYTGSIRGPQGETPPLDSTLSVAGQAAEAKAVGEALSGKAPAGSSDGGHDTVVAQGTSGIWTYRKWASGIAECWATQTETLSNSFTTDNKYGYVFPSLSFPFSFTASPVMAFSGKVGTAAAFLGYSNVASTAILSCQILTLLSGSQTCEARYYVVGRWK